MAEWRAAGQRCWLSWDRRQSVDGYRKRLGPGRCRYDVGLAGHARPGCVLPLDVGDEGLDGRGAYQGYHAAAEAAASLPRRNDAGSAQHGVHHRFHGGRTDFIQITRAGIGGGKQRAQGCFVAGGQKLGQLQHALDFPR